MVVAPVKAGGVVYSKINLSPTPLAFSVNHHIVLKSSLQQLEAILEDLVAVLAL